MDIGTHYQVSIAQQIDLTFAYDANGKIQSVMDSAGRLTTLTVDEDGNLTRMVTPELCITDLVYDDVHHLIGYVEPTGARTTYGYDEEDRVNVITTPAGYTTTYTHIDDHTTRMIVACSPTWVHERSFTIEFPSKPFLHLQLACFQSNHRIWLRLDGTV